MPEPRRRSFTVALIGTPAASAGTVYGFYDVLASTRRDWSLLHGGSGVESPFRPMVLTRDGLPFRAGNNVLITPDGSFADCPHPDIVTVTDLHEFPGTDVRERYGPELAYLRQAWDAGATLCSACSGALLLAGTGVLEGYEGTSHWAYCDDLARDYPRTRWLVDRRLVITGPDRRVMMGGSGSSWYMLALAVVARFASPVDAMRVARMKLLGSSDISAVAYSSLTRGAKAVDDPLISQCQIWAASNYRVEAPVSRLVALSGLPERTFKRRFTDCTGMSPLEYIHTLRLEEAKQLLESTDLPIEAVATEVGYQDASFFNRLFRRKVQLTPAGYRRRFGELNQQLCGVAAVAPAGGPAITTTRPTSYAIRSSSSSSSPAYRHRN
jgi:transcriptional regulator GlxA family with amidase domain